MAIRLLYLAIILSVVCSETVDYGNKNSRSVGDAPHSHRRLYGIRRLRMLRPIPQTVEHSASHRIGDRRRQPSKPLINSEELDVFVPRAQVPPGFNSHPSSPSSSSSSSSGESSELPSTYIIQTPNRYGKTLDDARRKRIEARWKRLGINFKTINYPHNNNNNDDESGGETINQHTIRQLNLPKKVDKLMEVHHSRPTIRESILSTTDNDFSSFGQRQLPAELPISGDYHSRTKPVLKGVKFVQEKLSVRPRLRIRRPGEKIDEPMPEDPNLTPFMNSARAKFGYGTVATVPPPVATTPYVPPTTPSRRPTTTEAVTEETPVEQFGFGEANGSDRDSGLVDSGAPLSGGDSGAGFGFGPSELPPEFQNIGFGVGGGDSGFNFNVPSDKLEEKPTEAPTTTAKPKKRVVQRKQPNNDIDKDQPAVIPQNSGLRAVTPPKEFGGSGGFGSGSGGFGGGGGGFGGGGGGFGGGGGGFGGGGIGGESPFAAPEPQVEPPAPPARPSQPDPDFNGEDIFTGDSALTPSKGPTGDGYGPPVFPGGAAPPPVPSVGLGGAAAGKSPYGDGGPTVDVTENPVTTVKPSALLSVLSKADMGFNQAIEHFEHGTPVETAAIDILEVALGSQKLDSQAKLLGHVDRTIGLDNLQRLQRWANTAGAMDVFKDQFLKFAKNFQPAADLLPTVPPNLEYLFKTSGKK